MKAPLIFGPLRPHSRVYYPQPGPRVSRSRLRTIWFTELAGLCGLSLNGQD